MNGTSWTQALWGVLVAVLIVGCDLGSDRDNPSDAYFENNPMSDDLLPDEWRKVALTPEVVSLSFNGQATTFNAVGGEGNYRWELEYPSRGDLEVRGSSQALYTRRSTGSNTLFVYSGGYTAVAIIQQP